MVIYYDLEGYSRDATTSCKNAVHSFLRGWVERLHARDIRAGGYGGSCSSYVEEWADINPAPDDVWLARWLLPPIYRPDATVWEANEDCVSNSLWSNHQRIRQYAGGHTETWGGVSLVMDSNVLDGHITSLLGTAAASQLAASSQVLLQGPALQDIGLIDANQGWALANERLLWTEDGGGSWQDISPRLPGAYHLLDIAYQAAGDGWLAVQTVEPGQGAGIKILRSHTGGGWEAVSRLPLTSMEAASIEAAYFDLQPGSAAWLALKLQSGSSFSLGRLFFTQDGGGTWQERSLPLGEAVKFTDELHGWTAGGPAENELYTTQDGGRTWLAVNASQSLLEERLALPDVTSLPRGAQVLDFVDNLTGWALVQENTCQGVKNPANAAQAVQQPFQCVQLTRLLATQDGGHTWTEITP